MDKLIRFLVAAVLVGFLVGFGLLLANVVGERSRETGRKPLGRPAEGRAEAAKKAQA